MPLAEVNGVRIEYRMDVSANLPVVLLSNSLSTTFQMWDGQMNALVDRFSVLRWNKRGHGASSAPPPPYTLRQLTEDVRGLLSVLDIDRVHFVGLSTGGAIGQLFAATYPEMTRTLTLCDTSSYVPPEVWDSRIANARANGMEGVADASMERWFTPEFRCREPRIVERFRQMVLETDIDGYIGCASSLKQRMLKPLLKTIEAPTHVIVGAEDPSTPVSHSEILHREIPNSELTIIPDAAHISNAAQPEAFNRALRTFLDRHSP